VTLEEERKQWEQEARKKSLPENITYFEESISGVSCLWVCEEDSTTDKVIVYLHGGGLISGSALTHLSFAAEMIRAIGISVVLVNYRLLPEYDYPAPLEDTLSVYNTLIGEQRYTSDQIILGGDSSGGGLVLAALVRLKGSESSLPCCAFTMSGTFDMTLSGESMLDDACIDPTLSFDELKKWQESFLQFDLTSPLLSPLFSDLSGLPPILLIAGGKEPWLSDSLKVAQKIELVHGVVRIRIWESMGHVWVMDSELEESVEALNEISNFVA